MQTELGAICIEFEHLADLEKVWAGLSRTETIEYPDGGTEKITVLEVDLNDLDPLAEIVKRENMTVNVVFMRNSLILTWAEKSDVDRLRAALGDSDLNDC